MAAVSARVSENDFLQALLPVCTREAVHTHAGPEPLRAQGRHMLSFLSRRCGVEVGHGVPPRHHKGSLQVRVGPEGRDLGRVTSVYSMWFTSFRCFRCIDPLPDVATMRKFLFSIGG